MDIGALRSWIGRQEAAGDTLPSFPANALSATLDGDERYEPGAALPPLWHWIYFHELVRTSELAENGHARMGGFLPPVPLPRRMWAGGRFRFERPLRTGEPARRVSTVADVSVKSGASGALLFLLLRHEFTGPQGTALVEEQDIVYREAARPGQSAAAARGAPEGAVWRRETPTNEALLFRYSALIFNAHRIHYDHPYCRREGYPGLIVHGPLIATLLAELVRANTRAPMKSFRFRALRPLFCGSPCVACGAPEGSAVKLWAEDGAGGLVMEGEAELGS